MIAENVLARQSLAEWLIGISAETLLIGACALVLFLAVAGWRNHRQWQARLAAYAPADPDEPPRDMPRQPFVAETIDVDAAIRDVARRADREMARCLVRLTIAVQPGLQVRCDPRALREVLGTLLHRAILGAPSGRVLFAAMRHGGRVQMSVTHDGEPDGAREGGNGNAGLDAALRDARTLVALHGGTIEMPVGPAEGRNVVLRLPAPPDRAAGRAASAEPPLSHAVAPAVVHAVHRPHGVPAELS